MSMKKSSDTIGNRTHAFPTCSAVPQPTAPPCAPNRNSTTHKHKNEYAEKNLNNFQDFARINLNVISNLTECDNLSTEDIIIIIIIIIIITITIIIILVGYVLDYCRL
jgi:hypothetical protein